MTTKTYLIRYEVHDGDSEYHDDEYVRADSYSDAWDYAQEEIKKFWEDAESFYDEEGENIDYVESDYRQARIYTVSEFDSLPVFNITTQKTEYISMKPNELTLHNK